jgi:prepilin-type N-terminal cleavage/methylation domain-containing protein
MRVQAAQKGITLVELLAALVISAFVVVMASRIFLSGNRQFFERFIESDRLGELHRLKGALQGVLKRDVARCASGRLWLAEGEGEQELSELLKPRFPGMSGSEIRCFEISPDGHSLVEWRDRFQPSLIEYSIRMQRKAGTDTLAGSWIK